MNEADETNREHHFVAIIPSRTAPYSTTYSRQSWRAKRTPSVQQQYYAKERFTRSRIELYPGRIVVFRVWGHGDERENTFIRVQTRALPRCVYDVYIHKNVHGFNKE